MSPHTPLTLPSQVQCRIFNTVFNPTGQRLGTKILRQRLKGPALAAYYPRKVATFRDLQKAYPEWEMYDEKEEDRLEHVQIMKAKGKGPPKKSKVKIGMYNHCTRREVVRVCLLTVLRLQRRRRRVGSGSRARRLDFVYNLSKTVVPLKVIASAIATHLLAFWGLGDTTTAY
jgi:hypothetical protein